ncbi:LOW QUALITY PROTEIN: hypothetical protein T265_13682 [Opisthorchis viverrini]|uniref:Uncharacterized protein n=1 Tax=Opisthorchis viverrini TaxID=6198 RepID=A0A075AFN7_OPIVI|nr:LOW QUALITY PROTEIN: hypothetical protein T265_13682 [Opisthorchis viverrini]KER27964.1 LOW QUALITY PROTEIN: hypothetical protein T265_13682 [Opisthorchis viverrini]
MIDWLVENITNWRRKIAWSEFTEAVQNERQVTLIPHHRWMLAMGSIWVCGRVTAEHHTAKKVRGQYKYAVIALRCPGVSCLIRASNCRSAVTAVAPFRDLTAMPPEGSIRVGILPGYPSLDRGRREAEAGFVPRTFRSVILIVMEEQMLFENLDEKLEDELAVVLLIECLASSPVITTTWLSINFELPIGEAEGTPETRTKTSIVSSPQLCCSILPISSTFDTKPGKKVSPKKTVPEKPVAFISKSTDQEEEEEEFLTSAVLRSSKRKRLIIDSDEETTTDPVEKVPQSRASPRKSADRDQKTTTKATKKILAADSETDSPTPKPARGRRPRSAAAATETERESSIASPSRESRTTVCSPKKPQASKPKSPVKMNRRRRQVLKTFMDDDGYMVTEKVWESASENDEEPDEPIEAVQSAVDAKPCVSPSKHDTDARLTGTPTLGSTAGLATDGLIIIIINDSMTSVLNTNASLPYSHDLFESLIVKKRIKTFTQAIWIETDNKNATDIVRITRSPSWKASSTDSTQAFRDLPHTPLPGHGLATSLFTPLRIGHGKQYSLRQTMVRHA